MINIEYKLETCRFCRERYKDKPYFSLKPAVTMEYNMRGQEEETIAIFCKRHPYNYISEMGFQVGEQTLEWGVKEWNVRNQINLNKDESKKMWDESIKKEN